MSDFNDPNFLLADVDPTPERELASNKCSNSVKSALIWAGVIFLMYVSILACTLFTL